MKICFVGPANSTHIIKWCNWFVAHNHEVHVISFTPGKIEGVKVHLINVNVNTSGSDIGKLKYLFTGRRIRRILDKVQPDIVNAHYATSYGVAVSLSGIKGYVLSVWGSDIYDFPRKSFLHKALLKYSLKKAGYLFSTSHAMAEEARKYTDRTFEVTPFGVDMNLFSPNGRDRINDTKFIIGTIKSLSDLYGIDYLIRATAKIKHKMPEMDLQVRIAGDGPDEKKYRELVKGLGLDDTVFFLGRITQEQAAKEWANMDVAVIPSVSYESFGVAAVEAQACETPVIISDVDGLMETTKPGITSEVVSRKDDNAIAEAIIKLYNNPKLRKQMGEAGRKNVVNNFEINNCFENIENSFFEIMEKN